MPSPDPPADVQSLLVSSRLVPLRREAMEHVAAARREGRVDEPWEQALAAIDTAVHATEVLARDSVPEQRQQD